MLAGFPKKRATFKRSGKLSFGADFGLSHCCKNCLLLNVFATSVCALTVRGEQNCRKLAR
jgi:hypothetical protein